MTLTAILLLLFALSTFGAFFLLIGAAIALWSFYAGRSGRSPVPDLRLTRETQPSKHTETGKAPVPIARGM